MFSKLDATYMAHALELAAKARGRTSPNPMVGAVVVKHGEIIGEGYHPRAGEPHAEVFALNAAGEGAQGADLYVTLEPCCHYGQTPPCTQKIISSGVRRVITATLDPNPLVAGKGVEQLRAAGIMVDVGLLEQKARILNEAFITFMTKGRPFVTAKWAMTLDGKIACSSGDSRWVSGATSRQWVHRLRNEVDAIMVGVGTVLTDNPELTTRLEDGGGRDPIRIILDTHLRTPPAAKVFNTGSAAPAWVVCVDTIDVTKSPLYSIPNVEILKLPSKEGRVDLSVLMSMLGKRKITHLLLEGGATVNYAALAAELVDKVYCFVAPKLIGGALAPSPVGGEGVTVMSAAWQLNIVNVARSGEDILIEGNPIYQNRG